jgi:hypothetical protein
MRANESVMRMTNLNYSLRAAMDLMTRDFLQVGAGLPPSHAVTIPFGGGSQRVRLPGPPLTNFQTAATDDDLAAVIPGDELGPRINDVNTDIVTVLMADNTLNSVRCTAVNGTSVTLGGTVNIATGPDRVTPGDLMMITKGSLSTLVQVTSVNAGARQLIFAAADSLRLNQPGAGSGSLFQLNEAAPRNSPNDTQVSRVRMITYYIDNVTTPDRPRLVRRVNNGNATTFDNNLGTVVAFDVENLQITYDIADGFRNPSGVSFTAADRDGSGACKQDDVDTPCQAVQVRKINVVLTGRASASNVATATPIRNTLSSQVSLRGMAFLNEYQPPCLPGQPCWNP